MGRNRRVINRLSGFFDMSTQPLPGLPIVELCGDRRVLIENHSGVVGYGREKICVAVKYGRLSVMGSELRICFMSRQQLVVSGEIHGVQIERI